MRKIIAIILCTIMLNTLFLPALTYAANDKGLENAIKIAKAQFKIPESYTFNFDVVSQDSQKVWSLFWTAKGNTGESISVRIDENGKIQSYENNKPYYNVKKKLPKISSSEAKRKAEEFIKKMNPKDYSELKLADNLQNTALDYGYTFGFIRMIKGVPYYANNVSVLVNKDSGEIQSYYNDFRNNIAFPDASKAIGSNNAQKAYMDKLGLELVYKYSYKNDKLKIYPVYTTKFSNDSYAIDALTGEKIQTGYAYSMYDRAYGMGGYSMKSEAANVALTPEEIKAVDEISKLMTLEEAEKLVRGTKFFNLSDDFKIESSNLSRTWPLRSEYQWQISFRKNSSEKSSLVEYFSVSINAKNGEILNFYKSQPQYGDKEVPKYDQAYCKKAAEEFLTQLLPDKFSQTELNLSDNSVINGYDNGGPRSFNFTYSRKVNGVKFPDNYMFVNVDAMSGEITNYNLNWFDVNFPSVSKVIPIDTAYGNIFSKVGLELQYKPKYIDQTNSKIVEPNPNKTQEVVPVYAFKGNRPVFIDAVTGNLLDYDGNIYKEPVVVKYSDVAGHYAEKQIMVLADNGIYLDGNKFKPEENITQKDFLILLSKTLSNYYGPIINASSTSSDLDLLYQNMQREGIIRDKEKAPNALLKREDGIKFIIRALKYDKVADIKGIFRTEIKDISKAAPELAGYIIVAQGLHIINSGKINFKPKDMLTRAETMIMLYNYLQL